MNRGWNLDFLKQLVALIKIIEMRFTVSVS